MGLALAAVGAEVGQEATRQIHGMDFGSVRKAGRDAAELNPPVPL